MIRRHIHPITVKIKQTNKEDIIRTCTEIIHTYVPEEEILDIHKDISLITLVLALLALRLGQCLLPDLASTLMIQVGEENVKDLGVPRNGVTLNTILDVLYKNIFSLIFRR